MTAESSPSWPPEPDRPRELAPGVLHLLAPNASSWTYEGTNSYVLSDGDAAVIVDPGCEDAAHHDALRRAAQADGRTVTGVLLTHAHPDHSDGARAVAASLGVPVIAMSPRFADEFLTDGQRLAFVGVHIGSDVGAIEKAYEGYIPAYVRTFPLSGTGGSTSFEAIGDNTRYGFPMSHDPGAHYTLAGVRTNLATFTNTRAGATPTGIGVDGLPYIVLIGLALAGLVGYVVVRIRQEGAYEV
jgi:hypothetical protein